MYTDEFVENWDEEKSKLLQEECEAELELMAMSKEQLLLVPHEVLKWQCCVLGCEHYTSIIDFGFKCNATYYHKRWGWMNLTGHIFYCGKHFRMQKVGAKMEFKNGSGYKHLI